MKEQYEEKISEVTNKMEELSKAFNDKELELKLIKTNFVKT